MPFFRFSAIIILINDLCAELRGVAFLPKTLKDMVYHSILTDIMDHVYEPYQILNEQALVEKYQCSKSPVREALLSLCKDSVLRSIPRCGYEVLPIVQEDVEQLLHIRYLLEGGLLQLCIGRLQGETMDALVELDNALGSCKEDIWQYWDLNTKFHLELMRSANNPHALAELTRICDRLKLAYAQLSRGKWSSRSVPYETARHQAILSCLQAHDLPGALEALRIDLMCFSDVHCHIPRFFCLSDDT